MDILNNQEPIYLQLAETICDKILNGIFVAEERIPSMRDIAADYEVNPNTVFKSFEFLQEKGIIFQKRGLGYFVTNEAKDVIYNFRKKEFTEHILPLIFKKMAQLNISINDIEEIYKQNNNKLKE
ncbi:MAG: GntR family transcriptional regulator [Bacteroidales bacterium]|jgi:DNA-binding transcriptional regulator YhcF (GntR family)|nr:GntR family transcriptional regulator [Bacteroidales bacterium]